MKIGTRVAFALLALALAMPAWAKPGGGKGGKPDCSSSLPAVQAVVAQACDCLGSPNHGQYVRCAARVVKEMAGNGLVGRGCRGQMVRTFAKSSCGKPEFVACCVPRDGATACVVKKSSVCTKIGGTAGGSPFCADACVAGSPSGAFVD